MSIDELNTLQQSVNSFISINSFFSTSTVPIVKMHQVSWIAVKSKSVADISSLSYFSNECEVLFMIGSIFRLIKIEEIIRSYEKGIWRCE